MSALLAALLAGLVAGTVHVLAGPDHLAAVAPLAADSRRGLGTGLRWGLGHAAGVLVVGGATLLLREALPVEALSAWSERLVGVVLIGIGGWGAWRALRQWVHVHSHTHDGQAHRHLHVHEGAVPHAGHDGGHAEEEPGRDHGPPEGHRHVHAAFGVGVLHGLAGSAHFLGVLPALALPTFAASAGYVTAFGVGSVLAMGTFGAAIGWVAARFAATGTRLYRASLLAFSLAAIGVGLWWLLA